MYFSNHKDHNNMFSFNNYRKVIYNWGVLVCTGFIITDLASLNLTQLFIMWTLIIAVSLFVQFYLMWWDKADVAFTQLAWLVLILTGGVGSYLLIFGLLPINMEVSTFWLGLIGFGMALTSLIQHNPRYIILCLCYFCLSAFMQFVVVPYELTVTGLAFLLLALADGYMETVETETKIKLSLTFNAHEYCFF